MMKKFKKYLKNREENNIINTGKNVNPNFWEEFILVLNNSEGLADLLGVSKNKILTWKKKIKEKMSEQSKDININKKFKIIKTGLK